MRKLVRFVALLTVAMLLAMSLLGCSGSEMNKELSGLSTKVANIGKDEAAKVKDLKIVDSGYTKYSKYSKKYGFATYGACVKNPNKKYVAKNVVVSVLYVSKDGTVLKTHTHPVFDLGPGQKAWIGGDGGNVLGLDHLEFSASVTVGDWIESSKKVPDYLKVSEIERMVDRDKLSYFFKVKRVKKYKIAGGGETAPVAWTYGVFKNSKGKIIGGASSEIWGTTSKYMSNSFYVPEKIIKKTVSAKISAYPNVAR